MKSNSLKSYLSLFFGLVFFFNTACAQIENEADTAHYMLLTYNVENLFDNDGIAVFDDYKKVDRDGNPLYSWQDVLNKARNTAKVIKYANEGNGPDILVLNELEADHSDADTSIHPDLQAWNTLFDGRSLAEMLEADVTLSSLQIIWKALEEEGLTYGVASGQPPIQLEKPMTVQMNAVLSKLPIDESKSQIHLTERARPVLEVHIQSGNDVFVVFANHWKSGAGGADEEVIRAQNASVVRARYVELVSENPNLDVIVTGDLNVNYDQHVSMKDKVNQVSLSDVLGANGLEADPNSLYNLWHELPVSERGSDTYRGRWGTLMHIILNSNWYDEKGFQYVDQSFGVLAVAGLNQYAHSSEPKRWSSFGQGYGFSDHFPVYCTFKKAYGPFEKAQEFTEEDVRTWEKTQRERVQFSKPSTILSFNSVEPENNELTAFYELDPSLFSEDFKSYGPTSISIYYPKSSLRNKAIRLAQQSKLRGIIGRFDTYRGAIQFVVEDDYALIEN